MKKIYPKIFILMLFLIVAYLYLSHAYTYFVIHRANLKATDNMHTYNIINNPNSQQKIIYAALGDSLTAGVGTNRYEDSYPYAVASLLGESKYNIIHENFSYPGARTIDIINDLLTPTIECQADIITLLIGTNDVHAYVSAKEFKENYDYILKELTSKTKAKINVISIPNIGSNSLIIPPHNFYLNNQVEDYNKIIFSLSKEYKLNYINLATPTSEILSQNGPHYSNDLFHPSASGYATWAKIIYDHINK